MTDREDMSDRQAMASLFRKKAAVIAALEGGMVKGGTNKHFDYKYITASDIKHTVGRLLSEHGLSLQMSGVATENAVTQIEVKDYNTKEVRIKDVPILRIQFAISLCDADTGAVEQSFWFGEAGASDDKAASKCATSALKYYLISNLLIADKEEDKRDTDRGPRERPAASGAASQAPKNTPPVPRQQPESQKPAQESTSAPANGTVLSSKDPDKWPAFLKWAQDKFTYSEAAVMVALGPVVSNGTVSVPRTVAIAHVLANAAGYNSSEIRSLGKEKKLSDEAISEALLIPTPEIPF